MEDSCTRQYGKNLDWKKTSYTTHDVATILRRYLTQMPEPIIPHELYHDVSRGWRVWQVVNEDDR
jgi:hypothetical protein